MFCPEDELEGLHAHTDLLIRQLGVFHPGEESVCSISRPVGIALFDVGEQFPLDVDGVVVFIPAGNREVIRMGDRLLPRGKRAEGLLIGDGHRLQRLHRAYADPEGGIGFLLEPVDQKPQLVDRADAPGVVLMTSLMRDEERDLVHHDLPDHSPGKEFLYGLPDAVVILLDTNAGADGVAQGIRLVFSPGGRTLLFTALHKDKECILFRDIQEAAVVLHDSGLIVLKHERADKAVFDDGDDELELLPRAQLAASFLPVPVDPRHCSVHCIEKFIQVERFCQVGEYPEIERLLCEVEHAVGGEHDEDRGRTELADLPDRINAVDARHADVHDRDVRPESFRGFDDRPTGPC